MEKFTVYSDKTTGISPFREAFTKPSLWAYIPAMIILPVKFILLTAIMVLLLPLYFTNENMLIKCIVWICNVNVEFVVDGVRRSDVRGIAAKAPVSGDVVVVNSIGPFDYIVWKYITNSPSIVCVATPNGCVEMSFGEWIKWCFSGSIDVGKTRVVDISGVTDKVVFVVGEGTITNGKAVIQFVKGLTFDNVDVLKVMSTKVNGLSAHTTGFVSKFTWIVANFGTLSSTNYRVKLSCVEKKDIYSIRGVLAENGKMKVVGDAITVDTKKEYLSAIKNYKKRV